MVGTEYREAQPRDNQSGNTAGVVFLPKPVVGEDSCKHGGQHEVQSFEVEGDKRTDEAAQRCSDDPIGFIEPGNPEQVPSIEGRFKKTPHLFSDEEHYLEMEVDFLQPFLDIEAKTALANPGEVTMA